MPGSPAILLHSPPRRLAYAAVAVLVGLTGGLGNALFIANLPAIQGDLGLTPAQGAWLPAAYFMVNVSTNLLLIKVRQQYGLRHFAELGLAVYALLSIAHVFVEGLGMAMFVRAASGFAAAATTSLGLFYMLQAFSKAHLPRGVIEQWRRWCLHPQYALADGEAIRRAFSAVRTPIVSLSFTDDEMMSRRSIESLLGFYREAPKTAWRIAPEEIGARHIGHFGFFRPQFAESLWAGYLLPELGSGNALSRG